MSRNFFKRYLPSPQQLREEGRLGILGARVFAPDLWHLNRSSASAAVAVGLFLTWVPVPGQMVLAALVAIWVRCNLPLAVASVWFSNPVTIPPLFYFAYKLGSWLLQRPPLELEFEWSLVWFAERAQDIWLPFALGSVVCAMVCSITGFLAVRWIWRWQVIQRWERRRALRRMRNELRRP